MGVGVAIAGSSLIAAAVIGLYLAVTMTAAIRTEEAFLRAKFGPEYDEYCRGASRAPDRPFSVARAWRNREYPGRRGHGRRLRHPGGEGVLASG